MLMQMRRRVWEGLSLESKNFVSKYLKDNLKFGLVGGLLDEKKFAEECEKFLFPDFDKHLLDGRAMHDMERAVDRILLAIEKKESIAVYGDYDCDGVPGTAIFRDFFQKIKYENVAYYIPDRHNEGYGLNKEAILKLHNENKITLLITLDLGTTNIAEIEYANNLHIDCIITDHHLPIVTEDGEQLPKAYAILNNKKIACDYANKDLCGSGTVFKLICEIVREGKKRGDGNKNLKKYFENVKEGYEKWLLDLVGIATIADMVPLTNENRILAMYGLFVLSKTNREGVKTIFKNAKTNLQKVTEQDIAFTLAPRINSASRMAHPRIALYMFSQDLKEGINPAHELEELNTTRKDVTNTIIKKIYKILDKRILEQKSLPDVLVIGDEDWNIGVLGILAQKILDKYNVNCFTWGKNFKGSCRGRGDVHVVKLMTQCSNNFLHFGGHEEAGGFATSFDLVHELENNLNKNFIHAKLPINKKENAKNNLQIFDLPLNNLTNDFYQALSLIGPFGMGNPKPVFKIINFDNYEIFKFGKNKEHLKITFVGTAGKNNSKIFREAIKFFVDEKQEFKILEKQKLGNLFFEVEPGWNTNTPRLKILD